MKALVYQGPDKVGFVEKDRPCPGEGEVLVKVKYCGVCGSDIAIWKGEHPRAEAGVILGHEFSGEIYEVGGNNSKFKIGDKVVVEPLVHCHQCDNCKEGNYNLCEEIGLYGVDEDGGFAEYVKVSQDKVIPLPPEADLKEMALTEPVAVAVNAVNKSNLNPGDTVLILGAGPIGLLVAQVARDAGAARVLISELNEARIKRAQAMGFNTVNPGVDDLEREIKKMNPRGADLVFDAVGHPSVVESAFKAVNRGGEINIVAIYHQKPAIDLQKLCYWELTMKGNFIYTWEEFRRAKILLENGMIKSQDMITDVLPFSEAITGLKMMKDGFDGIKILIEV